MPLGLAIAQLAGIYVLAQNEHGLVIVDMHAAHERIVYEKLKQQLDARAIPQQRLLIPQVFNVAPLDMATAVDEAEALADGLIEPGLADATGAACRRAAPTEPHNATAARPARIGGSRVLTEHRNELLATSHATARCARTAG
jgi:DNA mismatch repair protein MutL